MANITGTSAADLLIGVATADNDTVSGLGGDDLIAGEAGNDVLNGGAGVDILVGGTLNVTEDVGTVVLYPGDRDTASYVDRSDPLRIELSDTQTIDITRFGITMHLVGVGRETLVGSQRGDILVGIENLIGGSGQDFLYGDNKDNIFYGKGEIDSLYGAGGDDILAGGAGDDYVEGETGADILIAGDLTVVNGVGTVIDTGDNDGAAGYTKSAAGVNIDLTALQTVDVTRAGVSLHLQNAVAGHGGDAEGDWLVGVGSLAGSEFDDHLVGDGHTFILDGRAGDDVLEDGRLLMGGAGNDTLIGSQDGSTFLGDAGADVLDGSAGTDDTASFYGPAAVTIDLTLGTAHGGDAEGDVLIGIENVTTAGFDDRVIGSSIGQKIELDIGNDSAYGLGDVDALSGGGGSDRLVGGAGADTLDGGAGYDWAYYHTSAAGVVVSLASGGGSGGEAQGDILSGIEAIYGSAHNDALYGNSASNTLLGSKGADRQTGGASADIFTYEAVSDSTVAVTGRDVILDFSRAQGDKINLSPIDADGNAANGNTAFVYTAGGAFTGLGHEIVVQSGGAGISLLYADLNGDKAADFAVEVRSAIPLTGLDLML